MLKRVLAISAALLLGTFAFAQDTADGGATPSTTGSVNATWEWTTIPKSKIGTDAFNFKKQVILEPVAGSKGAQFALENGETKFKNEGYVALYHNNKDSATIEKLSDPKIRKAEYSVTIDDAATITLTISGNGFGEKSRCLALVNEAGEILVSADCLNKENPHVILTYSNAPKGTYKIWTNGSRIIKVEAKN